MSHKELFDVINKKDKVIGTATREDCHSNPDLLHRCVHFTLIDRKNGKVFLTQRSLKKKHDPGKYCFLGEHVLSGESYDDAIRRGAREELGFTPKKFTEVAHNFFSYQSQSELVRFYVIDWNNENVEWDESEMEQVMWVDRDKISDTDYDYSEMTQHWIDEVDWDAAISSIE